MADSTFSLDNLPEYGIIPMKDIHPRFIIHYWSEVAGKNYVSLQHRFCHVIDPTVEQVMSIIRPWGDIMYYIYSPERQELIAEFTLTDFMQKSAQAHFSVHPDNNISQSLRIATQVTDTVLNEWGEQGNPDTPFLYSLYGLIPVTNKPAWKFIRAAGFKKFGLLPGAQRDRGGDIVDAVVLVKGRQS